MKTNVTIKQPSQAEIQQIIADAQTLRGAYMRAAVLRTTGKLSGLFQRTPRGAANA